ncbi:MAG: hypothetical protein GY737_06265 [Desulfobacteraceae bacterium]|nr:hypothetical protein [Desulfobacteraceae bacterium]
MSDFLKNLRSTHRGSQAQRGSQPRPSGPTRKEIGERYYSGNERRTVVDRRAPLRPQQPQRQYKESDTMLESLPMIKENLATVATSLERMAESQENLAKVKAEQHQAMGTFFENLNQVLMEKIVPSLDAASAAPRPVRKGTTSYASGTHHTKDEVIAIIRSMREERATYAEIAEALTAKGIPTFSGRGDWHAQTIHRLCK